MPRVFDKVYAGVQERLAGSRILRRLIFRIAVFFKQRAMMRGARWDEVRHAAAARSPALSCRVCSRLLWDKANVTRKGEAALGFQRAALVLVDMMAFSLRVCPQLLPQLHRLFHAA